MEYKLVHAKVVIDEKEQETWISVSENFRNYNEEKMAYDMYYDLEKEGSESFCIDYLVGNRDRHGSNLEVLRNEEDDSVRMAPLFDQGVSLLFSTYGDKKLLENADVMSDFPVNNYIGAKSLEYNLSLIPKEDDLQINVLKEEDREYIFHNLDNVIAKEHINKIWEMIWKRWCYFAQIRNQEK